MGSATIEDIVFTEEELSPKTESGRVQQKTVFSPRHDAVAVML